MASRTWILLFATLVVSCLRFATAIPYSEHILAPSKRHLSPIHVHRVNGTVLNAEGVTASGSGSVTFGPRSAVTYDYGKDIGGVVSFTVSNLSNRNQFIGLSFTESSLWISPNGSDATQNAAIDETLWFKITKAGNYTVDTKNDRGSFRYLNIYHNTTGLVALERLSTYFTAMPHYDEDSLRAYTGFFHCDDEKLNRVWYAAAYTNQLCTIPSNAGDALVDYTASDPTIPTFWWANSTLTYGRSALVDGGKRDKLIWAGDYAISIPAILLSMNDVYTIKLSLQQLFLQQNRTTGQMPYVASPVLTPTYGYIYSFTYHLHGLIALSNYYIYTGDVLFLRQTWEQFKLGLNLSLSSIDRTGLAWVPEGSPDWGRKGQGGYNIEANAILYFAINAAIDLARVMNDTAPVASWVAFATGIRDGANTLLWDSAAGLYIDNRTSTLHPQDGNAWSVISGIADMNQARAISKSLARRWGPYGAPAPEAGTTVSPFVSGFELQAHFLAGEPQNGLDLMKLMWADFMLDDPRMTNSTFIEGYDVSGKLHYPPYADDARISHAHGWSTGPVIALSRYAAGLLVMNSTNWIVHPQPGNLSVVEAGFRLAFGEFSVSYRTQGKNLEYIFSTPKDTRGTIILEVPNCNADIQLRCQSDGNYSSPNRRYQHRDLEFSSFGFGNCILLDRRAATQSITDDITSITINDVPGGRYAVKIKCQGDKQ